MGERQPHRASKLSSGPEVKPSRISALVMVVLIASAMVSAVEARTIPLHDTHSADDIRNHCKDAGGSFSQDETGYGCSTNCKGGPADESGAGSQCSVSCSLAQKCKGNVPGRIRVSRGILSPRAAASR